MFLKFNGTVESPYSDSPRMVFLSSSVEKCAHCDSSYDYILLLYDRMELSILLVSSITVNTGQARARLGCGPLK